VLLATARPQEDVTMAREKLMTLTQAAKWLEEEYGLKRSPRSLWQWCYYGRQGTKLECVSVAGVWHTTAGAIKRFLSACTQRHSAESALDVNELKL
jgi:hypothetical protein